MVFGQVVIRVSEALILFPPSQSQAKESSEDQDSDTGSSLSVVTMTIGG